MPLVERPARSKPLTRAAIWPPSLPPAGAQALQNFLIAGPMLGTLGAMYRYALSQSSPTAPDPESGRVIAVVRAWRGQPIGSFYVTWWENTLCHALLGAASLWMVMVIAGLVVAAMRRGKNPRQMVR